MKKYILLILSLALSLNHCAADEALTFLRSYQLIVGTNDNSPPTNLNALTLDGIVPTANLGTGAATSNAFLAGNNKWTTNGGNLTNLNPLAIGANLAALSSNNAVNLTNLNPAALTGPGVIPWPAIPTNWTAGLNLPGLALTSLVAGGNSDVPHGTNIVTYITTGPSAAFGLNGIANGGTEGCLAMFENDTGYAMSITNNSGAESTSANRIVNGYGGTSAVITTNNPGQAWFKYNATLSKWVLIYITP